MIDGEAEAPARRASYYDLNDKQKEGVRVIGSDASHILLYGGSRSGKTFLGVRTTILRAAKFKHDALMARFRLSHLKATLLAQTWPNVCRACFPDLAVHHNKSEGIFEFPNGSRVFYAGLDDKDRTEKILGGEFATILLDEVSQIPWGSRNMVVTRLAQRVDGLRNKALYCENPPLVTHWSNKLFIRKIDPDSGRRLDNPGMFASLQMNPSDNAENLSPEYLKELDALPTRLRKRFRDGVFGDAGEAALFPLELLEQQTWPDDEMPQLIKVVVAVDPSGIASKEDLNADEVGIVVVGLIGGGRHGGHVIVLEDLTMRGSPAEWGRVAVAAYRRWSANAIVAEENFGGAMVKAVIMGASLDGDEAHLPVHYRAVRASHSKVVRAEPVSTLFEQQRAWLMPEVGEKLVDELSNFTTAGYIGDGSPNRGDAMIWGVTALHGNLIAEGRAAAQGANVGGAGRSSGPTVNTGRTRWKRTGHR